MVKEPKVQLKVGELYEITSGVLKEIVEIVSIHTDIEKINSLLNVDWNLQTTACIYHTKHIAGDVIYDSDKNGRFDYFSDNSKLAKSAIPLTPIQKLQYEFKEKVNENNMNTLKELPEKWFIKTNEESNEIVCDYYNKTNNSNTARTIGNYYGINKSNGELCGYMYYIDAPDMYFDINSEITFEQFKKWVLKEEIQPQFEVGKYYSFNWVSFNNLFIVAKVSDVDNNNIIVSFNNREGKYYQTDGFFYSDMANIKELSLENVQQYLPDGHADSEKYLP
jgi:hypothetical protein